MKKETGILLHVSSLYSKYGIGDFGKSAYRFIDYLSEAGVKYWQVLPLNQTGYSNSPYQSESSISFSPYFISPEILYHEKLIKRYELSKIKDQNSYVDYGKLYETRYPLLRKAFERFDKEDEEFKAFVKKGEYRDYALYMAIKKSSGYKPFYSWEEKYKFRDSKALKDFEKNNKEEVLFYEFLQFKAQEQWLMLKNYAKNQGVKIIGDMPLYVAYDSVDVWTDPKLYKLDENLNLKKVAGVPPDYFSKKGQLWGNPVYDYKVHEEQNFSWWVKRIKTALNKYDLVRIDHFRGLDRYYEIPANTENAIIGEWVDVPSEKLFSAIFSKVNRKQIIAEDLGIIDDGVIELLDKTNLPGMKVLSFAFNGESDNKYLPENINYNSVCYTGTHDNDTLKGLFDNFTEWDKNNFVNGVKNSAKLLKVKIKGNSERAILKAVIELGFKSQSKLFILPMTDALLYGTEYRMNEPGSSKITNWCMRLKEGANYSKRAKKMLKNLNNKYLR